MVILIILLIAFIILLLVVFKTNMQAVKISKKQSIIAFTGTLGSGKTYLAVQKALKAYRSQKFKNAIFRCFFRIKLKKLCPKDWGIKATLYSNMPIVLSKKKLKGNNIPVLLPNMKIIGKYLFVFSEVLKKEYLLERGHLPEKCVVVIDEIGAFASQWDYDNPLVCEQLEKFIRFFRHWLDGKMIVTDQVADNIVKPIRSRLGTIYNLQNFRRWLGLMPFYKIDTIPLLTMEDNTVIQSESEYCSLYFFGFLPYQKKKHKKYETRCYKPLYSQSALRTISNFESLYCRYLIDLSVSNEIKKDYKNNKDKYKEYLYKD